MAQYFMGVSLFSLASLHLYKELGPRHYIVIYKTYENGNLKYVQKIYTQKYKWSKDLLHVLQKDSNTTMIVNKVERIQ